MALYNEFRPRRFLDLVGNKRLVRSLCSQVSAGQTHHAYLFAGKSGTGKTTVARLLASSLTCASLNGETLGGCGVCSSCEQVRMGKHWDVIERDGAHIRGVDDTDELVRRAGLFPMSGKRKVYIIDECHRLSAQSWDVMLKLLEEPPPFVVIILCTTEPDKVPVTIKSRCAICAFDMPTESDIQAKLEQICAELSFPIDRSRLLYCVSASKGNFRAAENLLEQAYAEYIVEQVEELSG